MEITQKNLKQNTQQKTGLVFCCGGGITTGAIKEEGFNVLGGVDTWGFAKEIYEKNFPGCKFLQKSLRELTPAVLCKEFDIVPGEIDFIQISNPCTGVSSLGEGEQLSAVNDLFFVATALAFALNPKVVLFENVKSLTRGDMNMLFGMFWAFLQRAGVNYNMDAKVLNSWLYGDPQSRERIFIMCVRKDIGRPIWPETVPLEQRTYISDVLPEAEYVVNYSYGKRMRQPYEPAPTIVGGPCLTVYDGETERDLVPREYARFMGIPDWFVLEGAISNQKLLIGNGVTWGVTRSLSAVIRDHVLNSGPSGDSESKSLVELVEHQVEAELTDENTVKVSCSLDESKIKWTDYTWNPWTGCKKISAGCKFCYMFRDGDRYGNNHHQIKKTTPSTFNKPLKIKELKMVFTCSWSDFFIKEADEWREEAWDIIRKTPHLTYQILTKRPERILQCLPEDWGDGYPNVWLGVTVENQENVSRAEILAGVPAQVRFISAEPLLSPLDLLTPLKWKLMEHFHWVIIGGESGNNTGKHLYRECKKEWIQQLIQDVTEYTDAKIFVKQTGTHLAKELGLKKRHGDDVTEFPEWMQIQEWPTKTKPDVDSSHLRLKYSDELSM